MYLKVEVGFSVSVCLSLSLSLSLTHNRTPAFPHPCWRTFATLGTLAHASFTELVVSLSISVIPVTSGVTFIVDNSGLFATTPLASAKFTGIRSRRVRRVTRNAAASSGDPRISRPGPRAPDAA